MTLSTTADLESAMAGDTASFVGNQVVDPELRSPESGDFRPGAGSPAVAAATDVLSTLDADYQSTFGVTMIRPCWAETADIGALCAE